MSALSHEGTVKVDVKKMTKAERTELRRIVKRRFKLLREQIARRERELQHAFRKQIDDELASTVAKFESKMKPLIERQNKLAAAWSELFAEAGALDINIRVNNAQKLGSLDELKAQHYYPPVVANSYADAQKRLDEIKEAAGWSKLNLNEMEWRLDEQLAIGELETGSSIDFLSALPTVDTILPLPAGLEVPELEEGI